MAVSGALATSCLSFATNKIRDLSATGLSINGLKKSVLVDGNAKLKCKSSKDFGVRSLRRYFARCSAADLKTSEAATGQATTNKTVPSGDVGAGRVGAGLEDTDGRKKSIVKSVEPLSADKSSPIIVCSRRDALAGNEDATPSNRGDNRGEDLVFVQNGVLDPCLESQELASSTDVLVFSAVSKLSISPTDGLTDLNPEGLNATSDKWAPGIAASLKSAGLSRKTPEVDDVETNIGEKEKLRRLKIGLANKGKVPWNKGRQHSPETIERIKQRTYEAMHSPKVRAKLKLNPRHPQTDDTRLKIRNKLREQWALKKKRRGYQEACSKEWKEYVAEAARVGAPDEEEYAWNSYSVIKKKLLAQQRAASKSVTKVPKPRPSKSKEHRQKISAAIRAKWEDPEYQHKVRQGMSKVGKVATLQKRKKSPTSRMGVFEKKTSSEIAMDQSFIDAVMSEEKPGRTSKSQAHEPDEQETGSPLVATAKPLVKSIKKVNLLQRVTQKSELEDKVFVGTMNGVEPTKRIEDLASSESSLFLDPKAKEKLQKLKLLQANRAIMEQRRRECAYHARLLMAEAEKAARALEAAATKDEFALASLSETRRLMAEAARFIQTAESGRVG